MAVSPLPVCNFIISKSKVKKVVEVHQSLTLQAVGCGS